MNLQKIARTISTIFIPPTFTLTSFIYLVSNYENELSQKILVVIVALFFGVILQIASFLYFYKKGRIKDVDATLKAERTIPYYVSVIIFIMGFILLIIFKVNVISIAFWFCYISNTILVILINRYFKISIHAMGAAGPFALLVFIVGIKAMMLLPILIIVGWSRIKLKVHTLMEVIAGAFVGFVSVYIQLILFLNKY